MVSENLSVRRWPRVWKLESLAEITEKLQMLGWEQKNRKDQTLLLVYHAQSHSHWCERTAQPNGKCPPHRPNVIYPTSYKKYYCYLLVLRYSVRIFEITHGRLIHTGILTNTHSLTNVWRSRGLGWQSLELVDKCQSLCVTSLLSLSSQLCFCQGVKKSECGRQGFQLCFCQGVKYASAKE